MLLLIKGIVVDKTGIDRNVYFGENERFFSIVAENRKNPFSIFEGKMETKMGFEISL